MSGYNSYSMSNNAVEAYNDGKMPITKLLKHLKKKYPKTFRGLTKQDITNSIEPCEWHHTSCKYNMTDFYSLESVYFSRREIKNNIINRKKEYQEYKSLVAEALSLGITYIKPDFSLIKVADIKKDNDYHLAQLKIAIEDYKKKTTN